MKPYSNFSGDSGVVAYEINPGSIVVQFQDGRKYEYTTHSVGASHLATMKHLASSGRGLSAFIAQEVKAGFARKLG